jgi:hypothetical protein
MNLEILIGEGQRLLPAAPLLGCFFGVINLWIIRAMLLLELVALYLGVGLLIECYCEEKKRRRERDQNPTKPNNAPIGNFSAFSQPNKRVSLLRQLFGMLHKLVHQLRQLTACKNGEKTLLGVQLGTEGKHNAAIWKFLAVLFGQFSKKSANFFSSLFCNVRRFLGLTHKCNGCKQPNVHELSQTRHSDAAV